MIKYMIPIYIFNKLLILFVWSVEIEKNINYISEVFNFFWNN